MIDLLGLGSLVLVAAEWLGLGWLSGTNLPAPPTAATWALRLLVGSWLVAAAQLLLAAAGIGFSSIPLVLLTAAVGAGALRAARRQPAADQGKLVVPVHANHCDDDQHGISGRERAGWLLLGLVLAAGVVRALLVPEAGWDAYSHWGLRAQAFSLAGTIVNAGSEHEYYPPLVPLLEAWLYLHRGAVSIDLGKTIWAPIGSAFAVCLAWHLRQSLRSAWLAPYLAAGIVLGATAFLESLWTGQADLALTAYLSLATLAIFRWFQTPDRGWLVQAAIFGAAAALTKFEGVPRVGVVVLAVVLEAALARERGRWPAALALGGAAAVGWLVWTVYQLTHGIAVNAEHLGPFQPLAIGSVAAALLAVFGGVRTGGGLLVAALAWVVSGRVLLASPIRLITLVVVGELLATLIGFLLSAPSADLEVRTSATRLFEQFLPLALFVGAVGLARVLEQRSTYNRRGR